MRKIVRFATCFLLMSAFLVGFGNAAGSETQQTDATEQTEKELTEMAVYPNEVKLGMYCEDASGINQAPIPWKTLGESDGYVLLLSEKIIDAKPFNQERIDTDWESSTIRTWLNDNFYFAAFSESEQQSMKQGTALGDFVFLLSDEEVMQYLPAEASRTAPPTSFAVVQGVYTNSVGESAWWLRSHVADKQQTSYISSGGSFGNRAHYVDEGIIGVRPAIWIERTYLEGMAEEKSNAINVKQIWAQYDGDPPARQPVYYGEHITATGIVRYIGTDSHGTPSIELAEAENGIGYVLGVFGSYEEMEGASVGDLITMEGDFHILGSDNMVVIKNATIKH